MILLLTNCIFYINDDHTYTLLNILTSVLAQRKLVTYQTGYAGILPIKLSYDNSFCKERRSAVGIDDGPV